MIKDKKQNNNIFKKIREIEKSNWWHISRLELIKQFVKEENKKEKLKILDLGCGTGAIAESFNKDYEVTGLDPMKEAVNYASKRGIKVKEGNAENLPFKKESFDIVLCLDVLEHIKDDKQVVEEVNRVLKRGGKFIITVPAFNFLWGENDDLVLHVRRYTKKNILNLLKDFKIKKCSYWNFSLFFPTLVFRIGSRLMKHLRKPKRPNLDDLVYGYEMNLLNPFNKVLISLLRFENRIINKRNLPFGVSIVIICEK